MQVAETYPDDKSTVFSIAPFEVNEFKPGLYPGRFVIPPCLDGKEPQKLLVKSSVYVIQIAGKKTGINITQPSFQIAESIVKDFLNGQLFTEVDAHPGICWFPGDVSTEEFKVKHLQKYVDLVSTQKRWLINVVKKTEDDWKKYHNSRVVTDHARFAVKYLNIPTPEWMLTEVMGDTFNKCPACGTSNDPENAVCSNCRCVLNSEKFKQLSFA